MKDWRNFETDNIRIKSVLSIFLKQNKIYYEVSECFDGWHFEILCDDSECENVNSFLDCIF